MSRIGSDGQAQIRVLTEALQFAWGRDKASASRPAHPGALLLGEKCWGSHGSSGAGGADGFVECMGRAFPDLRLIVREVLGGPRIAMARVELEGTHLGGFQEIAPTGRTVRVAGMTTLEFRRGKPVRSHQDWSLMDLLVQLGVPPPWAGGEVSVLAPSLSSAPQSSAGDEAAATGEAGRREAESLASRITEQIFNQRCEDTMERIFSPRLRVHEALPRPGKVLDLPGWRKFIRGLVAAFPDLQLENTHVVPDVDRVMWRWVARGTHLGTFLDLPATGREMEFTGHSGALLGRGNLRTMWWIWDLAGLVRKIGQVEPRP